MTMMLLLSVFWLPGPPQADAAPPQRAAEAAELVAHDNQGNKDQEEVKSDMNDHWNLLLKWLKIIVNTNIQ